MIDLHLHLDGSIPAEDIIRIAKKYNIALPEYNENKLSGMISVDQNCESLNDYLKCFDIPLLILQHKESIKDAIRSLVIRLYKDSLIYAEIRFAPQLSTKNGLSQQEVVQAAIDGLNSALDDIAKNGGFFKANLILCCMRGDNNQSENLETVEVCSKFLGRGVVALDLAGAEAVYKTYKFKYIFEKAVSKNIPFTIHSGEADGALSIKSALEFGASRIGHGVRITEDAELLKYIIDNNIVFEMCPVSNVQTKAVECIKKHPIKMLLDMGAKVCVNTDNMVVSKTNIFNEFKIIENELGLNKTDRIKFLKNSIYGAFLPDEEKKELLKQITAN